MIHTYFAIEVGSTHATQEIVRVGSIGLNDFSNHEGKN